MVFLKQLRAEKEIEPIFLKKESYVAIGDRSFKNPVGRSYIHQLFLRILFLQGYYKRNALVMWSNGRRLIGEDISKFFLEYEG